MQRSELCPRPRAPRAVPVKGHVRVHVDETGKGGELPKVDHLRAGRERRVAGNDFADTLPLNDHYGIAD